MAAILRLSRAYESGSLGGDGGSWRPLGGLVRSCSIGAVRARRASRAPVEASIPSPLGRVSTRGCLSVVVRAGLAARQSAVANCPDGDRWLLSTRTHYCGLSCKGG